MQSKKSSFYESMVNVAAGLLISFTIQVVMYPLMGIDVKISQNILITFVFLLASLIRGYVIRRIFNKRNI
jgi:hypothetical protein